MVLKRLYRIDLKNISVKDAEGNIIERRNTDELLQQGRFFLKYVNCRKSENVLKCAPGAMEVCKLEDEGVSCGMQLPPSFTCNLSPRGKNFHCKETKSGIVNIVKEIHTPFMPSLPEEWDAC